MVDAIDTPHEINGRQEQEARRHATEPAYEAEDRRGFDAGLAYGDHLTGVAREPLCVPLDAAVRKPLVNTIAAAVAVLATVRQHPARCPEGDVLEHSLQVFDLVHQEQPFDEELLTAALVHDLGRAIDRADPVASGLEALGDLITPRTRWLVETLPAAREHGDQTLGHRARRRLEAHPDFLDALLLAEADRRAHQRGYPAPSLDEAVAILRALEDDAAAE